MPTFPPSSSSFLLFFLKFLDGLDDAPSPALREDRRNTITERRRNRSPMKAASPAPRFATSPTPRFKENARKY